MEALQLPSMIAALVMVCVVLGAKVMITQLVGRMHRQISQVSQVKQEALNRLKTAQGQKSVVEKNKIILDKKKGKLAKKLSALKQEMAGMKEEENARRQRAESRRVG